jgi:hypothetical protein
LAIAMDDNFLSVSSQQWPKWQKWIRLGGNENENHCQLDFRGM